MAGRISIRSQHFSRLVIRIFFVWVITYQFIASRIPRHICLIPVHAANQLIILAAILLGLLIILIIILAVVSNSTKKKRSKFEKEVLAANTNGANEPLVENFFSLAEPTAESFSIPSLTGEDEAETKDVIIKREIAQFSRQRPEIVAQLLRSWMNGDFEDGNAHKSASSSKSGSEQSDGSGENSGS